MENFIWGRGGGGVFRQIHKNIKLKKLAYFMEKDQIFPGFFLRNPSLRAL